MTRTEQALYICIYIHTQSCNDKQRDVGFVQSKVCGGNESSEARDKEAEVPHCKDEHEGTQEFAHLRLGPLLQ